MTWQFDRPTRRCASTGKDLVEGDEFYTVLLPQGEDWKRADYAASAWQGPPEGAVAWWKSQIPTRESTRARLAPTEALIHFFEDLIERQGSPEMTYLLSLLLLRRRVLRQDDQPEDEDGQEWSELVNLRTENTYRIRVVGLEGEAMAQAQAELEQLLSVGN